MCNSSVRNSVKVVQKPLGTARPRYTQMILNSQQEEYEIHLRRKELELYELRMKMRQMEQRSVS